MARILISAGEASGDIHAAAVTRELKNIAPDTEVFGMGGDCLREAGGEVLFDIKEHGVMGFAEIVCKLPALFKLKKAFAKVIEERKPDCLVVVDYPGFNMRLAKLAKDKSTKAFEAPIILKRIIFLFFKAFSSVFLIILFENIVNGSYLMTIEAIVLTVLLGTKIGMFI